MKNSVGYRTPHKIEGNVRIARKTYEKTVSTSWILVMTDWNKIIDSIFFALYFDLYHGSLFISKLQTTKQTTHLIKIE